VEAWGRNGRLEADCGERCGGCEVEADFKGQGTIARGAGSRMGDPPRRKNREGEAERRVDTHVARGVDARTADLRRGVDKNLYLVRIARREPSVVRREGEEADPRSGLE
jgi:hypothetical protein